MTTPIFRSRLLAPFTSAGLMMLLSPGVSYGATFFANSTRDAVDALPGDGICRAPGLGAECTLRAAIMEVNALPRARHTIVLQSGSTYTLTITGAGEDGGVIGDLDLRAPTVVITNSGTGKAVVRGGTNWDDRIFHIHTTSSTGFEGIEIRNGHADVGGGILCDKFCGLKNSTVSDNFSVTGGGVAVGVSGFAELDVLSSTISGNVAQGNGSLAGDGGGIWNNGGLVVLRASTISGNKAAGSGGGIWNFRYLDISSATIAKNVSDTDSDGNGDGGGIFTVGLDLTAVAIGNSVLALNVDQSSVTKLPDCAGSMTSRGYNLIQDPTGCTFLGTTTGHITLRDPKLGPLQNNGGLTFTHALQQGLQSIFSSPAIDTGAPTLPDRHSCGFNEEPVAPDQRGVTRPLDGNGDFIARCDIGAYEAKPLASDVGVASLEPAETTVFPGQNVIYTFTWAVPGPGWRVLDSLQLRIRDEAGTALWLRFQEVPGTPGTFSVVNPDTGKLGPAFAAGSANRLETQAATLYLADSTVDGPPGSRVTLTLDLSFKPRASGRTFQLEVGAVTDSGQQQDFVVAGLLTVQ